MGNNIHRTMVGGQAVIEGVMMRGVRATAVAVREPGGGIFLDTWENNDIRDRYPVLRLPLVRGVASLVGSLVSGYRTLMRSAEIAGLDDEIQAEQPAAVAEQMTGTSPEPVAAPVREEPAEPQEKKEESMRGVMVAAVLIGIAAAVFLFSWLPAALVKYTAWAVPYGVFRPVAEGAVRILIFVGYLAVMSLMPDMRRLFAYHGAEHKTIACYEHGEALTPENAARQTRFHPRCGTSFLLLVLLVGIVAYSFLTWDNLAVRVLLKLLLLPLVVGVSYEIIRFAGRHDTGLMRAVLAPGLLLQRLTTREPDESQLEVAIASLKAVLTGDPEEDTW